MDKDLAISLTDEEWEKSIIPELVEYIRVPNKSPAFDPDWQSNGFMEQVVDQFVAWSQHQNIEGMELDVIRLPKRTPLIFIDIPGDTENTVLLYGHLDKQPEMMGWNEGFGPWKPVLKENKLYVLEVNPRASRTVPFVAKSIGTSNPHNMIKATFDAFSLMNSPRSIANKRSKKVAEIFGNRSKSETSSNSNLE